MTQPSITCPVCHMTSYNPNDIREGYCGNCHNWTSPPAGASATAGQRRCEMILTATNATCGGALLPCGIEGFDQCTRCGTWVGSR